VLSSRWSAHKVTPELEQLQRDAAITWARRLCVALAEIGCPWIAAGTVRAQLDGRTTKGFNARCPRMEENRTECSGPLGILDGSDVAAGRSP
jgi:hypothetical protein